MILIFLLCYRVAKNHGQFNLSVNLTVKINLQVHYTAILSSTYTLHLELLQSA
jgi:hypothetical protein